MIKVGGKSRGEKFLMTVGKGGFYPADAYVGRKLRERGYKIGDMVLASFKKPRNPGFHRLAHQIGALCCEQLDDFDGMEAHTALKKLQRDGNIECEAMTVEVPGLGELVIRIPQSLSYESMEETRFRKCMTDICAYIARKYWPDQSADEVERMALLMPDAPR